MRRADRRTCPVLVEYAVEQVLDVKLRGTILMLERKLTTAPEISRGARIVDVGTTSESRDSGALLESDEVQKRYVGG